MSAATLPGRASRPSLRQRSGPAYTRIHGIGDYRPERVVTNAEICQHIDSSDEWIRERSGIVTRRQARHEESVADMAAAAARSAIEQAGIAARQVGAVLVATVTHPHQTPAAAPLVAHLLDCDSAAAIDVSAACAGYTYSIALADDMIRCGRAEYVVSGPRRCRTSATRTIAARHSSSATATAPAPRSSVPLMPPGSQPPSVEPTAPAAISSGSPSTGRHGGTTHTMPACHPWPFVMMEGPSVFRWATCQIVTVVREGLEAAGLTVDDLDAFIPHQANTRIIDAMVKKLKLPAKVVVARDDMADMASTSAASVPLATARLLREGRVRSGDVALQIGFGAGLAWAAQVIILP